MHKRTNYPFPRGFEPNQTVEVDWTKPTGNWVGREQLRSHLTATKSRSSGSNSCHHKNLNTYNRQGPILGPTIQQLVDNYWEDSLIDHVDAVYFHQMFEKKKALQSSRWVWVRVCSQLWYQLPNCFSLKLHHKVRHNTPKSINNATWAARMQWWYQSHSDYRALIPQSMLSAWFFHYIITFRINPFILNGIKCGTWKV